MQKEHLHLLIQIKSVVFIDIKLTDGCYCYDGTGTFIILRNQLIKFGSYNPFPYLCNEVLTLCLYKRSDGR